MFAVVDLYAHTSRFGDAAKNHSNGITIKLPTPTNFTTELTALALNGLRKIFKSSYKYQKCGIQLTDIRPASQIQQALFDPIDNSKRSRLERLTEAMDQVNALMGKDVVRSGAMDFERKWIMKQQYLSGRYTTRISEILVVKAK